MKDRKDKRRQTLTLCCANINLKENENEKINKEESGGGGGGGDGIISSSTRRDGLFSAIFGERSGRSSVFLCCSQIQGSSSPPMSPLAPKPDDSFGFKTNLPTSFRAIRANPSSKYKAWAGLGQQSSGLCSGLGGLGHYSGQFGSGLGRPSTRPNPPELHP